MKSNIIFYADDDADDLDIFNGVASYLGFKLQIYRSGIEILRALEQDVSPGIIFMDINMPRDSGFEVLFQIRRHPKYHKVPVIIYTTSKEPSDIEKAWGLGANFYIIKSGSYDDVVNGIRTAMGINWDLSARNRTSFVYEKHLFQ